VEKATTKIAREDPKRARKGHDRGMDVFAAYSDHRLTRPDGRVVAWTEWGEPSGVPLLRIPGTPGCRWSVRADTSPWALRGLRVITTERPGFGASTPLPGRGFRAHADDLAAILDHLGIERVHLIGASGAAPHELAFAQSYPARVRAATILVGAAPLAENEIETMIPLNQQSHRLCRAGLRDDEAALLRPVREAILADPLAAFRAIMEHAPADDQAVMRDPNWQATFARAQTEALGARLDGWVDESLAMSQNWDEIHPEAIGTDITWQHAAADANCPHAAARRLVDRLPNARFIAWPDDVGHLYGYRYEGEILDELLARG
jgi:pimeloyl-ACP methyl ester carboxylesterase